MIIIDYPTIANEFHICFHPFLIHEITPQLFAKTI